MSSEKISFLRTKQIQEQMDLVDFDAICLLSGISRERGHQIAISMFVENFNEIIGREFSWGELPYVD